MSYYRAVVAIPDLSRWRSSDIGCYGRLLNHVKLAILVFGLLLWLNACVAPASDQFDTDQLVIENVTAIDAENGVRTAMNVTVVGNKIASVEPYDSKQKHTGIVLDGTGKYLIPGLWDAHIHLTYAQGVDHTVFYPLALAHGVTSLRDTGGHIELLKPAIEAAKNDPVTPTLYYAGPLVDGALRIYDGRTASTPDLSVAVSTRAEAERMVDRLAEDGVHLIKAYEMLSPEVFEALISRAKSHNLPVAVHTPLSMSTQSAIEAGANDMQHLRNIEFDCAENPDQLLAMRQNMLSQETEDTARRLRSTIHRRMRGIALTQQSSENCDRMLLALSNANVFQTPTLVISRFSTRKLFADPSYRQSFDLMPPAIAAEWKDRSNRLMDMQPDALTTVYDEWLLEMVPRLHEAGVPIMAGTDSPIGFLTPGASLHEELAELVVAGLSPLEAIETATSRPAEFFGIDSEIGTIDPGKTADLVLLTDDPLADIRHVALIQAVIKNGIVLDRNALDELQGSVAKQTN